MKISSAIIGNLFAGMLGRLILALSPILLVPLMIRSWGLEYYGEWLLLTAVPSYIMLSPDFGLAGAAINEMASLTARGRIQRAVLLYRTAWVILSAATVLFFLAGVAIACLVNWSRIGVVNLSHITSAGIIISACGRIVVMQQIVLISGIYKSAQQNPRAGIVYSVGSAFFLLVGISILLLSENPFQYSLFQFLSSLIFLPFVLLDAQRTMPQFTLSLKGVALKRVLPYVKPGLGHAAMPLVNAFQNQGVLIILGIVLGSAGVALFQTTRVLSNGLKSVSGLATAAVMVELPTLLGQNKKALVERLLVRNTQAGIVLSLTGVLVMLLCGEVIYTAWLGEQSIYPDMLAVLLLLSIIPYSFGTSFTILLLSANRIHCAIPLTLVSTVFSMILIFIFSKMGGLLGAGFGVILWEIGTAAASVIYATKEMNYSIVSYLKAMFSFREIANDFVSVRNQIFGRI